ncbi:MAG: TIGR03943 family protein [Actinomycetota bacterium]|nr:TIGR03943 family protein [Actinomycetota bacterium]
MNKETQSIVVVLFGGLLVGITVSGRYTSYVKPGFGPLLLTAGIVLLLVGVISLVSIVVTETRAAKKKVLAEAVAQPATVAGVPTDHDGHADHDEVDAHGHSHGNSRAPWLILLPVLLLLLVAPTALGADAVARSGGSQAIGGMTPVTSSSGGTANDGYAFNDGSGSASDDQMGGMAFPALPAGTHPADTMKDFMMRSLYDSQRSVVKNPVTLTGFIAPAGQGFHDGYTVARMAISCCAADANPIRIHLAGKPPFPTNTWVSVVATSVAGTAGTANNYVPTANAISVKQIQQPADPYEH